MLFINISDGKLSFYDVEIKFPLNITKLRAVLGKDRCTKTKYNNIYTWDELGIIAYSKNGDIVENIEICYKKENYEFHPEMIFDGKFIFENINILDYLESNNHKLIKLSKNDNFGAFISGKISVYFDKKDDVLNAIEIGTYEITKIEQISEKLAVDDKYKYLESLWQEWIEQVSKLILSDNEYYNLTHGITQKDIKEHSFLKKNICIPDELINFYKIQNVNYNCTASAFSLTVNGMVYDLIPFKDIAKNWKNIQNLCDDFSSDELDLDEYDTRLKIDSYANSNWIPFAEYNGDYLLYDTDPSEYGKYGQIIEFQNESWERNIVADSFTELLQNELESLKKDVIEAIESTHNALRVKIPKIFNDIKMDSNDDLILELKNFDILFEKIILQSKEEHQVLEENGWKTNFYTNYDKELDWMITAIRDDGLTLSITYTQIEEKFFLGLFKKVIGKQLLIYFIPQNEDNPRKLFQDKLTSKFLPDIKEYWSNLLLSVEKRFYYENNFDILKQKVQKYEYASKVKKPFETVIINEIEFKVINRNEAFSILQDVKDFDSNLIYDVYEMHSTDGDRESMQNSFFLLCDEEVSVKYLYLDTGVEDVDIDDFYILGYIFTKKLKIEYCLEAYEVDFSPPIICLSNANITNAILSGAEHYFGANLTIGTLFGEYNHGEVYINGELSANIVISDEFRFYIRKIKKLDALVCNEARVYTYDTICYEDADKEVLNEQWATYNLEEAILPQFVYWDEYGYAIKDRGYRSGTDHYQEDEISFDEFLKQGKDPVNYENINRLQREFTQTFEESIYKVFETHHKLKTLPFKQSYKLLKDETGKRYYYFIKYDNGLQIGYWNLESHIVSYSNITNNNISEIILGYYDNENRSVKYSFPSQIEDKFSSSLVCQRIFREAISIINVL